MAKKKNELRSGKRRRKNWGTLVYYMAGGVEKRQFKERRSDPAENSSVPVDSERRLDEDRRRMVDTKYLNCGKVIDRRSDQRRAIDQIDETAVENEKYRRLGPGWI